MKDFALKLTVFALLTPFLFQGCATVGEPFQFKGPKQLKIGKTTTSQIVDLYGPPFRVGNENGHLTWTYGHYYYSLFGDTKTRDLILTFDKYRVLQSFIYNTSFPKEKAKLMAK